MKINKNELLKALEIVKPGLANKEIIQQSSSFAFINNHIVTYNDEISVKFPVKNLQIEGAIEAETFYKILSKLKTEEIELNVSDKEIQIKSKRSKIGLPLENKINLPLEEIGKRKKWNPLPENFIEALEFVSFTVSKDMSRPILTNVHVNKNGNIESSDNYRLTRYNVNELQVSTFLLSGMVVNQLIKYELTDIAEGDGWIHFKTVDKAIISCRIVEDKYPDISNYINSKFKNTINFPKLLKSTLEKALIFAKREIFIDEKVYINIKDKKITISSKSNTGAWFKESLNIKYTGEEINFIINPKFLMDILKSLNSCELDDAMLKFSGNNWIHIVVLFKDN